MSLHSLPHRSPSADAMSAQVAVTSSAPSRAAAPRRHNTHPRALLPTRRSKFANGGKIFRASKVVVRRSATVDAPKVVAVTNVVRGSRPGYVTFRGGSTGSISFKAVSAPEDVSTACLLYTSPSPRDRTRSRMPSSA